MRTMKMYFKAVYLFKNEDRIDDKTKSKLTKEFMHRREKAVELLNPCYGKWNAEFDEMYPGLDGTSKEYAEFICNKQASILDAVNSLDMDENLVNLGSISDVEYSGDIYGIYRLDTEVTFELEMVPVTI